MNYKFGSIGILVSIIIMVFPGQMVWSQNSEEEITITKINFEGLKKNKPKFLRRTINNRIGEQLEINRVDDDLKYLRQLSGIVNADYRIDTIGNEAELTFKIEEAMTLFPVINFGGIRNNFWFQLGVTEANLFGRGSQVTAFYRNNDDRHNFNLYYRVPFIRGSKWGASFNILRWASVEPIYFDDDLVFYNLDNNSFAGSIFYQFKGNHYVEFGGTYFQESFRKASRHNNEVTPGPDEIEQPKTLAKLIYQINEIDYHYFYLNGFSNQLNIEAVLNIDDGTWFNLMLNDSKYFKRIGEKGNLALRLRLGLSTNNDNPFAPFVLDSYVSIRGSGNRIDRGTAAIILNAEYRHTIFENKIVGSQLVAFADSGTWRNPGGDFSDLTDSENFRQFMGGGLRLIYKRAFNSMLRVDYGIDIYDINQRGLVVGFGQYF